MQKIPLSIPEPLPEVFKADPVLMQVIAASSPYDKAFDYGDDVYFALLESVVSQQISVKAADAIFNKFLLLFPGSYPHPAELLAMPDDVLRTASLSFQKIKYLRNVAAFSLENDLSAARLQQMSDEEIIALLTQIKGVGRWTVEMILMFALDRPDVFPIDDLVVRQKMILAYQPDTSSKRELYKTLHHIADQWRPHRSLAVKFLWRWLRPQ